MAVNQFVMGCPNLPKAEGKLVCRGALNKSSSRNGVHLAAWCTQHWGASHN